MVNAIPCEHLAFISQFLSRPLVSSLFAFHPNNLGQSTFRPPPEWEEWWAWAGEVPDEGEEAKRDDPWLHLLKYYESCLSGPERAEQHSSIPLGLQSLIDDACRLALSRDVGQVYPSGSGSKTLPPPRNREHVGFSGMSPKKAHEVVRMVDSLDALLSSGSSLSGVRHAVDIGAGQAYLSRTLRDQLNLHVLALDSSEVQFQGAARKDTAKAARRAAQRPVEANDDAGSRIEERCPKAAPGSLTYVTAAIDSQSLVSSTSAWLRDVRALTAINHVGATEEVTSVLFVALHACGSLTPDILRAFLSARKPGPSPICTSWMPQGAIVVGCCYNMMRPEDFPLSRTLRSPSPDSPSVSLSPSHLQLAAQVPSQWTRSQQALEDAHLALRKIVWRALIEDTLKTRPSPGGPRRDDDGGTITGTPSTFNRIGRLRDGAYADWDTFVCAVRARLYLEHLEFPTAPTSQMERRLETFHVLRCILGPVVESYILLDRLAWLSEELDEELVTVELVNLFDQASGSGRNVAIMIVPKQSSRAL